MAKKEKRFEVIFRDGGGLKDEGVRQILVDKETGVNYLCWKSGSDQRHRFCEAQPAPSQLTHPDQKVSR